jgi:hypothetical protein
MEPKMNLERIKAEAQERRPFTEWIWSKFEEELFVEDALLKDSPEQAVEFLVNTYDERVGASRGRRDRGSRDHGQGTDTVDVALSDLELERQAALEQYLAMCAACDLDVYRFRQEVLEGELLTEAQAQELLKSPAAALMETRRFKARDIPVVGHTADVRYERDTVPPGVEKLTATIAVHPPGITCEVEMPTWPGTSRGEKQRPVVLEFPDEEGRTARHEVWSISLLGELKTVGDKLSERYRWQPAQAVWFVLTGETPAVPALTVTRSFPSSMYHFDTLITVEASPWVSSRTVERAFRKAQIKTLGSDRGRPLGKKNLKLLRFVIRRIESLGKEELGMIEKGMSPPRAPKGRGMLELVTQYPLYRKMPNAKEIVSEWNETNPPQWSYGDDTRRLWKDYHRIKKSVAFGPPYR